MMTEKTGHGFLRSGMRFTCKYLEIMVLFPFALGLMTARAEIKTWNTTTGEWFEAANWMSVGVPTNGDDVVVTNSRAMVYLTNSTFQLSSLILSNATLSFSNWDTTLYVTNLTIYTGGVMTCWGPFTNTAVSNRVNVTCYSNLVIATNGSINVQGKGFSGGISNYLTGHGPGGGKYANGNYGGGGYGGVGSVYAVVYVVQVVGGAYYGSITAPLDPGSGGAGGNASASGSHGGGAVCITAAQVVVNGSINANALYSSAEYASSGSGGGIFITCSTITGTNGTITACGTNSAYTGNPAGGGGGGGGRIAVLYDPAAQSNLPVPSIRFSAAGGYAYRSGALLATDRTYGDIGTLYFPDNYFLSPTNLFNGQWMVPDFTNWSLADWTVSNVWIRLPGEGFRLTVTNTLAVIGTGTNIPKTKLELLTNATVSCGQCRLSGATLILGCSYNTSGPIMSCSGDLTLTNTSRLYVYSGLTNAGAGGYGALVSVGGDMRVATNCWIYPATHPTNTNGAATLFRMRNLTLDLGAGINADCLGYAGGIAPASTNPAYGPGAPIYGGGAGYGSAGGTGYPGYFVSGGSAYGSSNAPVDPGSGARGSRDLAEGRLGAWGGGSVQIRATDTVAIQGIITANGTNGPTSYGGGASGGGIYITCCRFIGNSNGVLRANGGSGAIYAPNNTWGGSGAGGRIAVWRMFDKSTSIISNSVSGGSSVYSTGAPGTIVWGWLTPYGTIFKGN